MKNQNIKAALFDLDGVVVFTDKYHYLGWKKLCDEKGWDFDDKINNRLRGIPRMASLEVILKHNGITLSETEKAELADRKNRYYVELLQNLNQSDVYNGSIEFIKALRERNVKISLCSSSKNALFVLDKLGISDLFDAVVTGADIKNAKPDPEIFLKGAEKLGIHPYHCVVFEDSLVGIQGAITGGMKSVGVGNKEETEDLADNFITDYSEIDIDTFIESGKVRPLPVDENALIEREYRKKSALHHESIFALGNGYLGVRGTFDEREEGECCGTYINGIFANSPYTHFVKFKGFAEKNEFTVNLPDWRIIELYIDGEKAAFDNGNIKDHERRLDFTTGALTRSFVFETKSGKRARVDSTRLVNRENVHGAEASYKVSALNFSGDIEIRSVIVKKTLISGMDCINIEESKAQNGKLNLTISVPTSGQNVAFAAVHEVKGGNFTAFEADCGDEYVYSVKANLHGAGSITLNKYVAFAGTVDKIDDISAFADTLAENNMAKGVDYFIAEQKAFWDKHWQTGDVKIKGNPADQQAVRFALFQLKQQLATVNNASIGATGLTGPHYSGQVFWDTEMYLCPYYNFTAPETQKGLLMYRYEILDKARSRAKEFDTVGAMYAWCSVDGEETSVIFEASTAEYHLNSDIAFAVWRYVDTTGDYDFLYDYGAEIVFETAKFMSHRGCFSPARGGRFCINAVCGPDEYACGVNNNFYTNMTVKFHLEYALRVAEQMKKNAPERFAALWDKIALSDEELTLWKNAAEKMYYSYNEQYGVYEQDDSYLYEDPVDMSTLPQNCDLRMNYHPLDLWRLQVSKQADVVLLNFLQGDKFTYDEKLRCFEYYEPRCNHGSSLSTAIYSIMAAELNKKEAYEFFRCSAYMDISDFKNNTDGGVHIACLGGVWMSVVNGFLGLRHYVTGIEINPSIPASWEEYSCHLCYKGATAAICVTRDKCVLTLTEGESMDLVLAGRSVTLIAGEPLEYKNVKSI